MLCRFHCPIYVHKNVANAYGKYWYDLSEALLVQNPRKLREACLQEAVKWQDPLVFPSLSMSMALEREDYQTAQKVGEAIGQSKVDLATRSSPYSLVLAMEQALELGRYQEADKLRSKLAKLHPEDCCHN